jgi:hypothetical protein
MHWDGLKINSKSGTLPPYWGWDGSQIWHFPRDEMDLKKETGQAAAHHMTSAWQPS